MFKIPFIFLAVIAVAACDSSVNDVASPIKPDVKVSSIDLVKDTVPDNENKLNLKLTDEILNEVLRGSDEEYADSEKKLIHIDLSKEVQKVRVSGDVFFEELKIGNIPSIEGGRIDIQFPF